MTQRDIKPAKRFNPKKGTTKLGDLARFNPNSPFSDQTFVGTLSIMLLLKFLEGRYYQSVGCLLGRMMQKNLVTVVSSSRSSLDYPQNPKFRICLSPWTKKADFLLPNNT